MTPITVILSAVLGFVGQSSAKAYGNYEKLIRIADDFKETGDLRRFENRVGNLELEIVFEYLSLTDGHRGTVSYQANFRNHLGKEIALGDGAKWDGKEKLGDPGQRFALGFEAQTLPPLFADLKPGQWILLKGPLKILNKKSRNSLYMIDQPAVENRRTYYSIEFDGNPRLEIVR